MGIINASPTGMGLLTNNGPQPWHPAAPELKVGEILPHAHDHDYDGLDHPNSFDHNECDLCRLCVQRLEHTVQREVWS